MRTTLRCWQWWFLLLIHSNKAIIVLDSDIKITIQKIHIFNLICRGGNRVCFSLGSIRVRSDYNGFGYGCVPDGPAQASKQGPFCKRAGQRLGLLSSLVGPTNTDIIYAVIWPIVMSIWLYKMYSYMGRASRVVLQWLSGYIMTSDYVPGSNVQQLTNDYKWKNIFNMIPSNIETHYEDKLQHLCPRIAWWPKHQPQIRYGRIWQFTMNITWMRYKRNKHCRFLMGLSWKKNLKINEKTFKFPEY